LRSNPCDADNDLSGTSATQFLALREKLDLGLFPFPFPKTDKPVEKAPKAGVMKRIILKR
jgi:hypothetical protein